MSEKLSNPYERLIVVTDDGSTSLDIPEMNEMYHSRKGARTESIHVYIDNGLRQVAAKSIAILEVGLGTGLNALLSFYHAVQNDISLRYVALEPFPLSIRESGLLKFNTGENDSEWIEKIHRSADQLDIEISDHIVFRKEITRLESFESDERFDVIYFDAFAPNKQSSPWVLSNLKKCYELLKPGGCLTTYCAQGQFKRNLSEIGFQVTNPEGPMGKREITVAYK